MDNLEKILNRLPKPKLGLIADLKIKSKLYFFILSRGVKKFFSLLAPKNYLLRNSLVIALIIIMVASGTSIYAYASPDVTRGHSLYGLKKAIENVEQQISFTETLKTQAFQKFSEKRLEEALRLSEQAAAASSTAEKPNLSRDIQDNIEEAVADFNSALTAASAIKNQTKAETARKRIKDKKNSASRYLDKIEKIANSVNDEGILVKVNQARQTMAGDEKATEPNQDKDEAPEIKPDGKKNSGENSGGYKKVEGVKIHKSKYVQPSQATSTLPVYQPETNNKSQEETSAPDGINQDVIINIAPDQEKPLPTGFSDTEKTTTTEGYHFEENTAPRIDSGGAEKTSDHEAVAR